LAITIPIPNNILQLEFRSYEQVVFGVSVSRAGSMYFGALGETSKWGLKKNLSKKKKLILLLY
jgi:hypothetical protein